MKYTLKSFLNSILTQDDFQEVINQEGCQDIIAKWDGEFLILTPNNSDFEIDNIVLSKWKKNVFLLNLQSRNYWYLTVEFSDGGLKKNKKYKFSEIYRA